MRFIFQLCLFFQIMCLILELTQNYIIKKAVKKFNKREQKSRTIERTFCKVYQDPWVDSLDKFWVHLRSLLECSLYKSTLNNKTALDLDAHVNQIAKFLKLDNFLVYFLEVLKVSFCDEPPHIKVLRLIFSRMDFLQQ